MCNELYVSDRAAACQPLLVSALQSAAMVNRTTHGGQRGYSTAPSVLHGASVARRIVLPSVPQLYYCWLDIS
jgi:hypothetical protein